MSRCVMYAEVPGFYAAVERADDPGAEPPERGQDQQEVEKDVEGFQTMKNLYEFYQSNGFQF